MAFWSDQAKPKLPGLVRLKLALERPAKFRFCTETYCKTEGSQFILYCILTIPVKSCADIETQTVSPTLPVSADPIIANPVAGG